MINKRRDFVGDTVKDFNGLNSSFLNHLSKTTINTITNGISIKRLNILPKYGIGQVNIYKCDVIELMVSKFRLDSDINFHQTYSEDFMQISFLLKGEKIISLDEEKQILFEERESYMAELKSFSGSVRILGGKMYKEIKIRLPKSFLVYHGFLNEFELKKFSDDKLVLPITEELFSILEILELKTSTGAMINRIYLKAKVFELLAIQMENYKSEKAIYVGEKSNKSIKRLYQVRQLIKANLHKSYSLNQIAKEVGMNTNTLNKEFMRIFNCSVYEFSISEKMEQARYLLNNTEKMIYQIADEVGYKNATHFSAAFKRKFKITPKKFRNIV